jgi:plasmid stability protein
VARYACPVTELRVTVPDEIAERLASEATEQGTSVEDVAAEVLRLHVSTARGDGLDFIALARSKPGFSARRAEEQLEAEGFG